MKKSAKPETKTPATKTPAKATAKKAPEAAKPITGTMKYNKDTKRFHAYDVKGGTFNGALYFDKDEDIPKTITLTIVS